VLDVPPVVLDVPPVALDVPPVALDVPPVALDVPPVVLAVPPVVLAVPPVALDVPPTDEPAVPAPPAAGLPLQPSRITPRNPLPSAKRQCLVMRDKWPAPATSVHFGDWRGRFGDPRRAIGDEAACQRGPRGLS
jgi:hypothetical protein